MTQEQKAKRYDEALNWMRELYPGLHGATKEDAEHFFPELAESEDERIRKALIEGVRQIRCKNGITQEQMIAWLEKQKETSHISEMCKENADSFTAEEDGPFDEDEFLEDELSAFLQNYDKEYDDDAAVSDVARHFYEIGKKQNEQNSSALQNAFERSVKDYSLEEKRKASDYADSILPTSIAYGESDEEYKLHKIIEAAFIAGQKTRIKSFHK